MSGIPPFPTPPQAQVLDGQTGPFPGNPELGGDAARSAANSFPARVQQFLGVFRFIFARTQCGAVWV